MLVWTVEAFEAAPFIDELILVVHRSDRTKAGRLIRSFRWKKVKQVVTGGSTRSDSVFNGLKTLSSAVGWVVIHDGARPLIRPELIRRTLKAAQRDQAAIAALPVVPTLKEAKGAWVERTLKRDHLWSIQTPQVFQRDLIEQAYTQARANGARATDDSALVEALGHPVRIVRGDPRNLKVTTSEDLIVAEALLKKNEFARRNRV